MSGKGTFVKLHGGKSEYFEYDMRAKEGFKKVETNKQISGHQSCIDEWVKQLLGEQARVVTDGTESRKTVEVAEAAYRSEQQGKVVSLPL
ncbi:MAG: hypothetical protein K0R28_4789 [Paenibacillus sp.]|jgi:predicted dehydrogenase|nr:hypothetical protein [Paenibacillus sp.]